MAKKKLSATENTSIYVTELIEQGFDVSFGPIRAYKSESGKYTLLRFNGKADLKEDFEYKTVEELVKNLVERIS